MVWPKQILYAQLKEELWFSGGQKAQLKNNLRMFISFNNWEKVGSNITSWKKSIKDGCLLLEDYNLCATEEKCRMLYTMLFQVVRFF